MDLELQGGYELERPRILDAHVPSGLESGRECMTPP